MEISLFLAKFWGWYFIIFFVILSFNPKRIRQIFNDLNDQKFLIITSFIAIIIGLLNILFHNIWTPSWPLIITLIGWAFLISGLALFIFPKRVVPRLEEFNIKFVQVVYLLIFFLGLFLLNSAYNIVLFNP